MTLVYQLLSVIGRTHVELTIVLDNSKMW